MTLAAHGLAAVLEGVLRGAQHRFIVPAQTSPRARRWVAAHRVLTFPLLSFARVTSLTATLERSEIRIVCVGPRRRFSDLLERLFGPVEPSGSPMPRCAWREAKLSRLDADLVMVDVHPWHAQAFRRHGWLIVPESISWSGNLHRLPPLQPPERLRSDLRKLAKYGYWLEEGGGDADWQEFFDGMMVPHAQARFEERASLPTKGELRDLRSSCRLLFVRKGDTRVAGGCVASIPNGLWLPSLGVRNGDPRLLREGALSALYFLTFEWARRRGHRRFDAGTTLPFPRDGVAYFKHKLGLSPSPNPLAFTTALLFDPGHSALMDLFRTEPVFHLANGKVEVFSPLRGAVPAPAERPPSEPVRPEPPSWGVAPEELLPQEPAPEPVLPEAKPSWPRRGGTRP